jgi:hypothetical protein
MIEKPTARSDAYRTSDGSAPPLGIDALRIAEVVAGMLMSKALRVFAAVPAKGNCPQTLMAPRKRGRGFRVAGTCAAILVGTSMPWVAAPAPASAQPLPSECQWGGFFNPAVGCLYNTSGRFMFTVPAGVTQISATVVGGRGGDGGGNGTDSNGDFGKGGAGARVKADNLPVAPGDTFHILVAGDGTSAAGTSGGGGGGASEFREAARGINAISIVAAGGGGGAGSASRHGGGGGNGGDALGDGSGRGFGGYQGAGANSGNGGGAGAGGGGNTIFGPAGQAVDQFSPAGGFGGGGTGGVSVAGGGGGGGGGVIPGDGGRTEASGGGGGAGSSSGGFRSSISTAAGAAPSVVITFNYFFTFTPPTVPPLPEPLRFLCGWPFLQSLCNPCGPFGLCQ